MHLSEIPDEQRVSKPVGDVVCCQGGSITFAFLQLLPGPIVMVEKNAGGLSNWFRSRPIVDKAYMLRHNERKSGWLRELHCPCT